MVEKNVEVYKKFKTEREWVLSFFNSTSVEQLKEE